MILQRIFAELCRALKPPANPSGTVWGDGTVPNPRRRPLPFTPAGFVEIPAVWDGAIRPLEPGSYRDDTGTTAACEAEA